MRGAETADRVWREVAGFRGPGLSETSRPFDAFTPKKKKMETGREKEKEVGEKQEVGKERMAKGGLEGTKCVVAK